MINRRTFCLSSVAVAVTPAVVKPEPTPPVEDTSCADEMLRYLYEVEAPLYFGLHTNEPNNGSTEYA